LPFRREERLGRLARARGPLTIIIARVVLLFPVVDCLVARDIDASVELRALAKLCPVLCMRNLHRKTAI
jgi:hypothetical protein